MDAHCLKEKFFTVLRSSTEQAEERLSEWVHIAEISSHEDFQYCIRTLKSWFDGIICSFATVTSMASPKAVTTRLKI